MLGAWRDIWAKINATTTEEKHEKHTLFFQNEKQSIGCFNTDIFSEKNNTLEFEKPNAEILLTLNTIHLEM